MYARKASLAIDGKAMYFRGEKRAPGVGPQTSKPQPLISRIHTDKARK
jgi:hypothetical protein